ncbi:SIMPL domain-containing protein [Variovorax robiniae]|uniref:SIMPL domain-containing protein n=1 Tax=Variovorax robiniae TaxID=1836199 RepID=A0ABU8XBK2_9BURK
MNPIRQIAAYALLACASATSAQTLPPPQNVLQLSASGTVEVQQDLLNMTLSTTRDGPDAATIQGQIKTALESGLAEARRNAEPGQLEVRIGNISLAPRYTRDGKISGWAGYAEMVMEGRDFQRIAQVAGRITTLTVGNVGFGLSREQRAKIEGEAQTLAINAFKLKADELARGFGFAGYTLREVSVNASSGDPIRPRMMAAQAKSMASDSAIPIEAGKTNVVVNVSGSVQLK